MGKGGGGKGGGKRGAGKALGLVGLAVGFAFPAAFGFTSASGAWLWSNAVKGALFGLSLGSTIGSAFQKPKNDWGTEQGQFDAKMNIVDSNAMIPIVYGTQKIGGLQTYHQTVRGNKELFKHLVLCEGEVEDIYGITLNNYLVKYSLHNRYSTGAPLSFRLTNYKHSDAWAMITTDAGKSSLEKKNRMKYWRKSTRPWGIVDANSNNAYQQTDSITDITKNDKFLVLYAGGGYHVILLQHEVDLKNDQSNYANTSISGLFQLISGAGSSTAIRDDGWELIDAVVSNDAPERLNATSSQPCYNGRTANFTAGDILGKDSYVNAYCGNINDPVPSNYGNVGAYPSLAYLTSTIKYQEDIGAGNPTITAIVKGRRVYDTRTGRWQYSTNPAMCLRDYLLNKTFGAGQYITSDMLDEDSFKEVANYCDEMVTYDTGHGYTKTEKRYELNIVLQEKKTHVENIQTMLKCFLGFIVFSNDRIALRCERAQSPVYHFDNSNIVEKSLSFKSNSIDQAPNRLLLTYVEPALNYTGVKVVVEDLVNQQPPPVGRGRQIETEIQLGGVTSQSQALRLGKVYRDIIRLCPITATFKTGAMASHLEPGDVITISKTFIGIDGNEETLLDNVPARIQEIREERGVFTITARQYNPTIYDDRLGAQISLDNYLEYKDPIVLQPESVAQVTSVYGDTRRINSTVGSARYDLLVWWDRPSDNNFAQGSVYYREKFNDGTFSDWRFVAKSDTNVTIHGTELNHTYQVRVYSVDKQGREHTDIYRDMEVKISVNASNPNAVKNVQIDIGNEAIVTWSSVTNTDVYYYEVRLDNSPGTENSNLLARVVNNKASIKLKSRTGRVYVYARNVLNVYSPPAYVDYSVQAPPKPSTPTIVEHPNGFVVSANAKEMKNYGMEVYINSDHYHSDVSSYDYIGISGLYDVSIAYTDVFGAGPKSNEVMAQIDIYLPRKYFNMAEIGITHINEVLDQLDDTINSKATQIAEAKVKLLDDDLSKQMSTMKNAFDTRITNLDSNVSARITGLNGTLQSTIKRVEGTEKTLTTITQADGVIDARITKAKNELNDRITKLTMTDGAVTLAIKNSKTEILKQVDGDIGAVRTRVSSSESAIGSLQKAQTNIVQTSSAIETRVSAIEKETGEDLITKINLTPGSATISSKLLVLDGKTVVKDDFVVDGGMLAANSITANKLKIDKLSAITANVGDLRGGTITGTTFKNDNGSFSVDPNGNIKGAHITASTIDADSMRLSGLKITASTVERYVVNDGDYCPIPAGFSESDCTFLISGVAERVGAVTKYSLNEFTNCNYAYEVYYFNYKAHHADNPTTTEHVWVFIGLSGRKVAAQGYDSYGRYTNLLPLERSGRYSVYVTVLALKK